MKFCKVTQMACSVAIRALRLEKDVDPEVLQSRFGVNFLIWSGEIRQNCHRISQ